MPAVPVYAVGGSKEKGGGMSFRCPGEGVVLKQRWTSQLRNPHCNLDRAFLMRNDKEFGLAPLYPAGRRCAHCPTILRRTNPADTCALCQARRVSVSEQSRNRERERLVKNATRKVRRKMEKFLASVRNRS